MSQITTALPVRSVEPKESLTCPICNKREVSKKRRLYGFRVCKKCWGSFTNRRQAAYILDVILLSLAVGLFFEIIIALPGFSSFPRNAVEYLSEGLYYSLFVFKDSISGMSPGKWLLGVQVVDIEKREPIGAAASFKRNLALALPYINIIFLLVGVIQMSRGPRIGDGWAKTLVIWRKYARKPPFDPSGIYCLVCDYNLTGNVSGICPECGTPVPEDTKAVLATLPT